MGRGSNAPETKVHRLRPVCVALTLLVLSTGSLGSSAGTAQAVAPSLPITTFGDFVVDDVHDRLFISQGFESTEIVVVDLEGVAVGTIPASKAGGLDLSPDSSTLYAALEGTDQIGMYDSSTLEPVGAPVDAGGDLNGQLEVAGGSVWFGFDGGGCPETPSAFLGSMPLGGGTVTAHAGGNFPVASPRLAASASSDVLITYHPTCAGNVLTSWSAATDPPTLMGTPKIVPLFLWSFEVSEGGGLVFVSDSSIIRSYRTSDLEERATYDTWPAGSGALATTSANGGWLASGGPPNPTPGPAVSLHDIGGGRAPEGQFLSGDHPICHHGMGFNEDGTTLFAIECSEPTFELHAIDRPTRYGSDVMISAKRNVDAFAPVRITAHLPEHGTNGVLRIERTPLDGNTTLLVERTVNSSGDVVATVRLTRQTRFVVTYEGDDGYLPGSDAITVRVRLLVTGVMLQPYARSNGYALYHDDALYRATVKPPKPGKSVYVQLHAFLGGRWQEVATAHFRLNANSRVRVRITDFPVGRYRIRTTRPGDRYNLQGVSTWDRFRITG